MKLKGKKALITGGSTGIGRAIAIDFAKEGADLVINFLNTEEEANDLKVLIEKQYQSSVLLMKADVGAEKEVKAMVANTVNKLGTIDILVNCAGIVTKNPLTQLSIEQWDHMMNINLRGPFLCTKFVLPHMLDKKYGRIINIASQLGQIGKQNLTHYCASKAGVIGFTKALAREVASEGITVNCIAPGLVETNILKASNHERLVEKQKILPISRLGIPEEVAPSAVLLASSPDGDIYTGQTLGPNSGEVML